MTCGKIGRATCREHVPARSVNSSSGHGVVLPFEFQRNWADLSAIPTAAASWAHNGIAVTSAGELIGFHAGQLVAFSQHGDLLWTVQTELTEGHGITLVNEDGEEYLWICDPSFVFQSVSGEGDDEWAPLFGKGIHRHSGEPRVVKMSMDGMSSPPPRAVPIRLKD
jgi:hypothetical protein